MPLPQDPRNPRLGPDIMGHIPFIMPSTPTNEQFVVQLPEEVFLCRYSLSHTATKEDARFCGMIKDKTCGIDNKPCEVFRFIKAQEPPIVTRDID